MDNNPAAIKFVQADGHNYRPGRTSRIRGWTWHDVEGPEGHKTAENVAAYFQRSDTRTGGAHYTGDDDSTVQCVRDGDTAYHAPGVSHCHLGYELAGYAGQSRQEWHDPFSWKMLEEQAAPLLAAKAEQYGFPLVILSVDDLKAGRLDGVTTHAKVSLAFHKSTHTDPGAGFPEVEVLEMSKHGAAAVAPPKPLGMKLGDKGKGVEFLQFGVNVLRPHRITSQGKRNARDVVVSGVYDRYTREAVAECQRFFNEVLKFQHKAPMAVTGVADPVTIGLIGWWVRATFA